MDFNNGYRGAKRYDNMLVREEVQNDDARGIMVSCVNDLRACYHSCERDVYQAVIHHALRLNRLCNQVAEACQTSPSLPWLPYATPSIPLPIFRDNAVLY